MRRLLSAILVCSACSTGTRIKTFAPVKGPDGVTTTVARGRRVFAAELVAASDTALLVLRGKTTRIVLVRYAAATQLLFQGLPGAYTLTRGHSPDPTTLEQLRLWSRFPTGVDSLLLQRLLSAYGQDSLDVLPLCASKHC